VFIIKELDTLEIAYINIYDSFKNGYNSTEGAEGNRAGFKHTLETKQLLSRIKKNCFFKVRGRSREVFGYDLLNNNYMHSETVAEMARNLKLPHGSVWSTCSSTQRQYCMYGRYLFAYSLDELENNKIKWSTLIKK